MRGGTPLIAGQCEDLVVIHDSVQGLDPHWIDVAIKKDPLGSVSLQVGNVPHDARKQPVLPLLVLSGSKMCKFCEFAGFRRMFDMSSPL